MKNEEVTFKDCNVCAYNTFARVVVVHLMKRRDRLENFTKMQKDCGWPLDQPQFFSAIDGNKVGVPNYWTTGGPSFGCQRSHLGILERAIMDDVSSLLVLEDDACWRPDMAERLKAFMSRVPEDWDQLMLGGQHMKTPEKVTDGVVRCYSTERTHAYAVSKKAMSSLYRHWCGVNHHIDWGMGRGGWQAEHKVYAPEPFLFGQDATKSDIGREDSRRFWSSAPVDLPVVVLTNAPRNAVNELRSRGLHFGYNLDPKTGCDKGLNTVNGNAALMRKWLDVILWEVACGENLTAAVWHPKITADLVRQVHKGAVLEVLGETADECLRQLNDLKLKPGSKEEATATLKPLPPVVPLGGNGQSVPVVLLRSSRGVAESLSQRGWHMGNWRDPITGQDNGLRRIVALPVSERAVELTEWIKVLLGEAAKEHKKCVAAWHPNLTVKELQEACGKTVVEIKADSVDEALGTVP